MRALEFIRSNPHAITALPLLAGILLTFATAQAIWIEIGVVLFGSIMTAGTTVETVVSMRRKLPRDRRGALVSLMQFGGYSVAAAGVTACAALGFWGSYKSPWMPRLVRVMFAGFIICLSSGLVYRRRKKARKREQNTVA